MSYEQSVFISYAWKGESEEIVNQIDKALQSRGMRIIRDKRDLGYKGSITEFMERIGRGACVIVVISDKYLRSPNCMFELVEIAKNKSFYDRVFPIVLSDADIYNPVNRIKYIKYWEGQLKELDDAMKSVNSANLQGIREDIDNYAEIRDRISELTSTLKDMNTLTPEMHQDSNFTELFNDIESHMRGSRASNEIKTGQAAVIRSDQFEPPETVLIPAGSFLMGADVKTLVEKFGGEEDEYKNEIPQYPVSLPAYYMGKYPVTNIQYKIFLDKAKKDKTWITPIMRWNGWTDSNIPAGKANLPIMGISWYQALEYCKWLKQETNCNYQLPNEAQWEKACRGGMNCIFPWGDEYESARSNHGSREMVAVDRGKAQNEYGLFDFVGNVLQWTCSLWGTNFLTPDVDYSYPWENDYRNNMDAHSQVRRVVRGSSFKGEKSTLRCTIRRGELPEAWVGGIGFRVVMTE
jgi:formylglycine-generating enzyme required for sulfatase activity